MGDHSENGARSGTAFAFRVLGGDEEGNICLVAVAVEIIVIDFEFDVAFLIDEAVLMPGIVAVGVVGVLEADCDGAVAGEEPGIPCH